MPKMLRGLFIYLFGLLVIFGPIIIIGLILGWMLDFKDSKHAGAISLLIVGPPYYYWTIKTESGKKFWKKVEKIIGDHSESI